MMLVWYEMLLSPASLLASHIVSVWFALSNCFDRMFRTAVQARKGRAEASPIPPFAAFLSLSLANFRHNPPNSDPDAGSLTYAT